MFARYFYGGYNGTTSILLAVVFNVAIFLISMMASMIMLPFLSFGCIALLGAVAWGLFAAAKNPDNSTSAKVMCSIFGLLQLGFFALVVIGLFR